MRFLLCLIAVVVSQARGAPLLGVGVDATEFRVTLFASGLSFP